MGRILTWTLSTFRIIVIVTEFVVMSAFLSRFWLDARLTNLNESLEQKSAVIAATSDFEKEFRNTQKQLKIFSQISTVASSPSSVFETITNYLPLDVLLTTFTFTEKDVKIKGIAPTEKGIAQFIANLEEIEDFKDVSLTQLDTSEEEGQFFVFTLKLELK